MPSTATATTQFSEGYSFWGDEFCEVDFSTATHEFEHGCCFERILTALAVAEATHLDDHHVVVNGETYVPSGILEVVTSKFLSWAVREGLVIVTPRGITRASFGN